MQCCCWIIADCSNAKRQPDAGQITRRSAIPQTCGNMSAHRAAYSRVRKYGLFKPKASGIYSDGCMCCKDVLPAVTEPAPDHHSNSMRSTPPTYGCTAACANSMIQLLQLRLNHQSDCVMTETHALARRCTACSALFCTLKFVLVSASCCSKGRAACSSCSSRLGVRLACLLASG